MKHLFLAIFAFSSLPTTLPAADPTYADEIQKWRDAREKKLRADNGWLTLAGRYPLKEGANTFGTGKDNDVVLPAELKGTGPERLGTLVDAIKEGEGLFFVFRDGTAGDTTYGSARFIDIEKQPKANETFTLDFNKAYNPPCAFSNFTTCPRPPEQNILKARIEAAEKYREKR
jgi:uncharacterized protein (DUF1684 family)